MKLINKHWLFSFLILVMISNTAVAQGYGYYPPSYGYGYPPQYHYPLPPPGYGYGYPYYPPLRSHPAQQQKPKVRAVKPKTTTKADKTASRFKAETVVSSSVKKQKFIELLLPHINRENKKILADRQWLEELSSNRESGIQLSQSDSVRLRSLAKAYKISTHDASTTMLTEQLLRRVDIIPASLTLAQAANETGWGSSRFAREANNYFGIWTYEADKGLKPKNREANKKHYVRIFSSPAESVTYYMKLLNTHPAYQELRNIRATLRRENNKISGTQLAQGLEKYSAKGSEYIKLITLLITQNQWAQLDTVIQTASS